MASSAPSGHTAGAASRPAGGASGATAVLRHRPFLLFVASRFFSGTAMTLLRATFAWQIFELTKSAFALGMIGLVQFVPTLALSLLGGVIADAFDRRRVIIAAQLAAFGCSAALFAAARFEVVTLPFIYAVILAAALASAFEFPARAALLPALVGSERFPSAVVVNSTVQNIAWTLGPIVMGFVIAAAGVSAAYAVHMGLIVAACVVLAFVPSPPMAVPARRISVPAVREGVAYVWRRQAILGSMTLDMFAVIFGGATALLPIYAQDILHVGARGYGVLSAAIEIGTVCMSLLLLFRPTIERPGRALLIGVGVYGAATVVFALSRSFPLSVIAFIVAGMGDQISVVARSVIIQLSTPDELRGRVSSVNMVFIGASNQLGAVESGFVAAATSATFSAASGGIGCLLVLAVVALTMPELRHYRLRLQPHTIN